MPNRPSSRLVLGALFILASAATLSAQASDWAAPARAAKRANPVAPSAQTMAAGKAVYLKSCASCHGQSGDGNGPKAKDLDKHPESFLKGFSGQSDGALFWKITEGKKPMPSFETDLSPTQVWQVVTYIRAFAKGK